MKAPRLGSEEVLCSDRISHLPNDLLFRILSFIPARHAISTSLLSKRWKFVWKMMPTFDLHENYIPEIDSLRIEIFWGMYLQSLEAPVLTSLNLTVRSSSRNIIDRLLSKIQSTILEITITSIFPMFISIRFSWYLNFCQTLVVMKLQYIEVDIEVVDVLTPVCFRALKCLHLTDVIYSRKEYFPTLLSACPVLEDLYLLIETNRCNRLDSFTISVPSLQRLTICEETFSRTMYAINTPSLNYLKVAGGFLSSSKFVEDMPMLAESHVDNDYENKNKNILRFLTSVERLSIHFFSSMVLDLTDSIFHRLLHLELYLDNGLHGNLILSLLKHSPNLKALKVNNKKPSKSLNDQQTPVSKPDTVPECLTFHLETLEWRGYVGRSEDKEIAEYILENARCLNMAMISRFFPSDHYRHRNGLKKDRRIVKELKYIYKASPSCQLVIQRQHNP
ncbi:PREDICTED: putative FBD-associated F-box protein At5g56820 [Camelina sativa]|uniref:FBD-associated F-box protein At5g56820 n=1 Tax=Camelina sativa TaxID=90675 RepID=A0ABM0UTL9_CAMSA|nr:PREDICTED: putative FBD-associated F-box protein At5g56820 [Camelina sativa]